RFFSFHHHEPQDLAAADEHAAHRTGVETCAHHDEEHFVDERHHDRSRPHSEPSLTALSWGTAAFGLAIHSLVGGVALASAITADFAEGRGVGATGWGVFLATVVHKPADALTIVSLMLRSGVSRRLAHLVNAGFALMIPLGVALFTIGLGQLSPVAASAWTAVALAFSAGTFLCIASSDLLPELQFHSHDRFKLSFALLAGLAVAVIIKEIETRQPEPPTAPA